MHTKQINGGGELSEHCRQWQFTLRWFCYFVKISISWWLTIYLRYRTHFTLHSFISSECTTWCQFILKKPVKLPRMVSIFTSRTARRVVHIPFYILNTCINISPYYGLRFYWRFVWLHNLIRLTWLVRSLCRLSQHKDLTSRHHNLISWHNYLTRWYNIWQVDIIICKEDLSDHYVDLSENYVDLSDDDVDLSDIILTSRWQFGTKADI